MLGFAFNLFVTVTLVFTSTASGDKPCLPCGVYWELGLEECLWDKLICDGGPDCRGGEDENKTMCRDYECSEKRVKCDDGLQCIDERDVCDGKTHCDDGSDENPSFCQNYTCFKYERKCADGKQCVRDVDFCDILVDCLDGSDETDC